VVPFDIGFVRRPDDDASLAAPPLATMLRGGRGGEVRLKLFLSMQLIAVAHPYDVTRTASYWAHLLSLPEPGSTVRAASTTPSDGWKNTS
jgi:hypothetical protein